MKKIYKKVRPNLAGFKVWFCEFMITCTQLKHNFHTMKHGRKEANNLSMDRKTATVANL